MIIFESFRKILKPDFMGLQTLKIRDVFYKFWLILAAFYHSVSDDPVFLHTKSFPQAEYF